MGGGYHGGVILIITTLKEKLSRRRREVYRQRVSVIFSFSQKQVGVRVVVGLLYNTILPSHYKIRGAFFVAKVGCHVDEEFECRI